MNTQDNLGQNAQWHKPSRQEVSKGIAERLGVSEEAVLTRIKQIVWHLGRTQAQALCEETFQLDTTEEGHAHTFFHLVETKGKKKERPWLDRQEKAPEVAHHSQVKEVAQLIADQLEEQEAGPRKTVYRSVKTLGVEVAQALLQRSFAIEEAGGVVVPDGSRRRTVGGVYFWLVRQEASKEQRRGIFPSGGRLRPAAQNKPHEGLQKGEQKQTRSS